MRHAASPHRLDTCYTELTGPACRGVLIAVLHGRGGGELGRGWHLAGAALNKWASLYDYAAGLAHLFRLGVTRPGAVALEAFSAGAVPAASALAARPDLFAGALLRRPFVALLETMADSQLPLTVHEYEEWGCGEDYPGSLRAWRRMCPHQRLTDARCAGGRSMRAAATPSDHRLRAAIHRCSCLRGRATAVCRGGGQSSSHGACGSGSERRTRCCCSGAAAATLTRARTTGLCRSPFCWPPCCLRTSWREPEARGKARPSHGGARAHALDPGCCNDLRDARARDDLAARPQGPGSDPVARACRRLHTSGRRSSLMPRPETAQGALLVQASKRACPRPPATTAGPSGARGAAIAPHPRCTRRHCTLLPC